MNWKKYRMVDYAIVWLCVVIGLWVILHLGSGESERNAKIFHSDFDHTCYDIRHFAPEQHGAR